MKANRTNSWQTGGRGPSACGTQEQARRLLQHYQRSRRRSWPTVCLIKPQMSLGRYFVDWQVRRHQAAILAQPDYPKAWSQLYGVALENHLERELVEFCQTILRHHPSNRHAWTFLQMVGKDGPHKVD